MKNYSKDTIDKIGNAIIYLSERIPGMGKTKILKLLYFLEECSVKKHRIPFFGIDFMVWKLGPVAKDIYIDLSSDDLGTIPMLGRYIDVNSDGDYYTYRAKKAFCNDEFSDNDIEIMDYVVKEYGHKSAKELCKLTHRNHTAWHAAAEKEPGLIERFKANTTNSSELQVDLAHYLSECERDSYLEIKETWGAFDKLKN